MGLLVILDLPSLKNEDSKRILQYENNEFIEFLSFIPSEKYTQIEFEEDPQDISHLISIEKTDKYTKKVIVWSHTSFPYRLQDIKHFSQVLDIKYDDLLQPFVINELSKKNEFISKREEYDKYILVTERKKLLNKSIQAKNPFPSLPEFTIFSPSEAKIYIDLYMKKRKLYKISPIEEVNKGLWYLLSMKTKAPNYQLPWSVIVHMHAKDKMLEQYFYSVSSLGDRLTEMLMAIDEIGMSYYEGSNNDTLDTTIYHFNYWVSLYAGVLDNLAWISKFRYIIQINKDNDVRLYSNRKDHPFITQLSSANPKIAEYIKNNMNIINLIGGARDSVLHRERLQGVRYVNQNKKLNINALKLSEQFQKRIRAFAKSGKNPLLGEHEYLGETILVEPYSFVQNATPLLYEFVNEYLNILDFEEYVKQDTKLEEVIDEGLDEKFLGMLKRFNYYALGY